MLLQANIQLLHSTCEAVYSFSDDNIVMQLP